MRWWSGLWRERSSVSIFFQSLSSRSGTFRERVGNVGGGMTVVGVVIVRMNIWRKEGFGVGVFPELLSLPKNQNGGTKIPPFWLFLAPPADPVEFFWFKMPGKGVPHIDTCSMLDSHL